jgi:RNA polymerase sigma-70 factor (ECF subfamily)
LKDRQPTDVLGNADVEATEAPVVTSQVAGRRQLATDSVETIVEEAYDAYASRLKSFARVATRDEAVADDMVQETFLRFVRELRTGRAPENVGGWLFRVCANLVTSRGRRNRIAERMKSLFVENRTAPSPDQDVMALDDATRLRGALAELPGDARVALLMAAEGFSSAEIGAAIGRSPGATATYLCRTRVRVRELLATTEDRP